MPLFVFKWVMHVTDELLDLHDQYNDEVEPRPFKPLRRFFKIYVRGFRGASELRNRLIETETTDEVRALLDEYASVVKEG
ncbi:hypothetical protein A6P54_18205 [Bacillus sp. MKU004]|nr:hypothetical protein A6P54_18205 [Bacillus sp. MKU004]